MDDKYKGKADFIFRPLGLAGGEEIQYTIDYDKEITITLGTVQYLADLINSLKDRQGIDLNTQIEYVVQEMYAQFS